MTNLCTHADEDNGTAEPTGIRLDCMSDLFQRSLAILKENSAIHFGSSLGIFLMVEEANTKVNVSF